MATNEDLLAELLRTAQEQLRWLRASVLPDVRKTIETTLTTTQLRQAYEMCDGTKSGTEIANAVGTSKQSVSTWTRRWRDLGIAHDVGGHIRHLTSLASLGLSLELESTGDGSRRSRATKAI